MKHNILIFLIVLVALVNCREPFNPPEIKGFEESIVIDANVNGTTGEASVVLSVSKALNAEVPINYISGADIYLQTEEGETFYLISLNNGRYEADNIHLDYGDKIQLKVTLDNGDEYISELEEFIKTPEIDSVSFIPNDEGVQFYVTTHDTEENIGYYKWEYDETWKIQAAYNSFYTYELRWSTFYGDYIIDMQSIKERDYEQLDSMQFCFSDNSSREILLASSKNLSEDVIYQKPILFVNYSTNKFIVKYSLLVRQSALTEKSYIYWDMLESNTEGLGTIFDKSPYQFSGNIKSVTNPNETVIGYFSVYSETQKRIFVTKRDVISHERTTTCSLTDLQIYNPETEVPELIELLENRFLVDSTENNDGFNVSEESCVDCRLTGYTEEPDFWE